MANEKTEEVKQEVDVENYKKRFYADKFNCVGIETRIKRKKTQVVLTSSEGNELTYKLVINKTTETQDNELGMAVKVDETEQVKEESLNKYMPSIFKEIAKYLKENANIELRVSYFQSALLFDTGIQVYKTLMEQDVQTIYAEAIHKDKERLETQKQKAKESEERKKGKVVGV